jgi:hypothetical protein
MSVAGFVGFTEDVRGKAEQFKPKLITSWTDYLNCFAKPDSDGFTDFNAYLPFAVKGWFDNGGGRCWVVSIGTQLPKKRDSGASEASEDSKALESRLEIKNAGNLPCLSFTPKDGQQDQGTLFVRIERDTPPPPANDGDEEVFDSGEYFKITIERDGKALKRPQLTPESESDDSNPSEGGSTSQMSQSTFDNDHYTYRHLTMASQPEAGTFVQEALRDSPYLQVEVLMTEGLPLARRPANGRYEFSSPPIVYHPEKLHNHIYGEPRKRTGVRGLFAKEEVSMVACPDLMRVYQEGYLNEEQIRNLMEVMITGCEDSSPHPAYRMAVLDPLPDKEDPQDMAEWVQTWGRRSQFAALYYPWIEVPNPRDNGRSIQVPPCGHMMGIWCQTDETHGIHKAPANVQPRGVTGLAYDVNFREQEYLNPIGVNCIRRFPNRGIQVWGARTLVEPGNTEWRYISVRRLMSYIERSIELETQWAVFEPNDEDLWARVTRTVRNFLERLWRDGALFGSTPDEAFYVKCDGELNTPETMMLGRLFIDVGVAPVRPAEFVVFRVSQFDPTAQ